MQKHWSLLRQLPVAPSNYDKLYLAATTIRAVNWQEFSEILYIMAQGSQYDTL